jgi:hypothetical protein
MLETREPFHGRRGLLVMAPAKLLALIVSACLFGAAVAGCGSSGASPPAKLVKIAANTDKTYAKGVIAPGATVVCKGTTGGAVVPEPGNGVSASPGPTVETQNDGSVRVECPPAEVGQGPFS